MEKRLKTFTKAEIMELVSRMHDDARQRAKEADKRYRESYDAGIADGSYDSDESEFLDAVYWDGCADALSSLFNEVVKL